MLQLELSAEDVALLRQLVDQRLRDLQHEIHQTQQRDFRAFLTRQEGLLRRIAAQIAELPAPVE